MADIFENSVVCDKCNKKTIKSTILKEGFQLRAWQCPECKKIWMHPLDEQEYNNFNKLKNKTFEVKLRMVGNSYTVSIPREIIDFENEMMEEFKKMDNLIRMSLDEPERLSLFFGKRRRIL